MRQLQWSEHQHQWRVLSCSEMSSLYDQVTSGDLLRTTGRHHHSPHHYTQHFEVISSSALISTLRFLESERRKYYIILSESEFLGLK